MDNWIVTFFTSSIIPLAFRGAEFDPDSDFDIDSDSDFDSAIDLLWETRHGQY